MTAPLVEATGLSLAYRLAHDRAGTLKEYTIRFLKRQIRYELLWAVLDVSFTMARGEVLGVIGPNGAGKTTLMKLVAGVLPPTSGRVVVRGQVAPLIALGAGFHDEMTCYENILLYGALLGRDPDEMHRRVGDILAWAGLEGYLDVPLRSLSSGMRARLGFAVATDARPELLIVDEVLAVGDERFRARSEERIRELMAAGTGILLVSHALDTVAALCDRVMWLHEGRIKELGDPERVVAAYRADAVAEPTGG